MEHGARVKSCVEWCEVLLTRESFIASWNTFLGGQDTTSLYVCLYVCVSTHASVSGRKLNPGAK